MAETTRDTITTEPSRRSKARQHQRSIHGGAASEATTPTREPSVANCPVVASEVRNASPIGRSRGLRTAKLRRVTAAPKQSTISPAHVRKVYLLVVSTLSSVVRFAIPGSEPGNIVRPGEIGFRSCRDNEIEEFSRSQSARHR